MNFLALWSKDCEDLQQFSKWFSQDEIEFCQILNWVTEAFRAKKCYWMKKSFKPVIEYVLEIIFTNLQVHTTRFVTFTTQKPSYIEVMMMLAVRSHA